MYDKKENRGGGGVKKGRSGLNRMTSKKETMSEDHEVGYSLP